MNYFNRLFLCIVITSISFYSCSPEPKITYDLKISNVQLLDAEDGSIRQMDIYILDKRIAKIIRTTLNSNFAVIDSIDATGKFAVPGYWDNHVHFRGGDSLIEDNKKFLKLFLANGITTVRDAGGDLTKDILQWRTSMENGTLDGPTIYTSGPKVDGPAATWPGSLEVENEIDIATALDVLERIPVDFVKIYDSKISGENYLNTIKEAKKRELITSGHMPFTVTLDQTIEAGIDGIEHLYYILKGTSRDEIKITKKLKNAEIGFWEAMPLLLNTYDQGTADKVFSKLKGNHVFVIPTLHIGHTLSYLDEEDHSKDAYLKYMSNGIKKTYQGRIDRVKNAGTKTISNRKELNEFFVKLANSLNNAGVSLLAGSDSGAYNSYTYPGISLHKELEAMVNAGITPLEALKTSAYNGSKFLKKDTDYGWIDEGKIADVVLLNSNPIIDIKNTQDIYAVLKNGKMHTKQTLDSLLISAIPSE